MLPVFQLLSEVSLVQTYKHLMVTMKFDLAVSDQNNVWLLESAADVSV